MSLALQKEMFEVSKDFFDLPLKEKMALDKSEVLRASIRQQVTESNPLDRTSIIAATKSYMAE